MVGTCSRGSWLVAVLLLAGQAAGQTPTPPSGVPTRLRYEAPLGCPSAGHFLAHLRARNPAVTLVTEATAGADGVALVEVRISAAERVVASLTVVWHGETTRRTVTSDTCEAAAAALSLIAAVALDEGATGPPLAFEETAAVTPSTAATTGTTAATGTMIPAAHGTTATVAAAPPAPPAASGPTTSLAKGGLPSAVVHLGGSAELHTAPAPNPLYSAQGQLRLEGTSVVPFAALIGFTRGASATVRGEAGAAHFLLTAFELRACPWLWTPGGVRLGPCLFVEVGTLEGRGRDAERSRTVRGPWATPGAMVDWRWHVGPMALGAAAGCGRPLVRDVFLFDAGTGDDVVVHHPGPIDWRGELSAAIRLHKAGRSRALP
ncbi:MAG: hypothetical protein JW751_00965 [Polyangiaceae bacterium]|nr:hypothetical protein [Polyangiaceae bacterium]